MKIIYYYQTFVGLDKIINDNHNVVTHIHLSSIHFGLDDNAKPYIHLNNNDPRDQKFDSVWNDLKKCKEKGIKIVLMVGGAGGAYQVMFSKYATYRNMLFNIVDKYRDIIDGLDLDIEEPVTLDNIQMLINDIHLEYGNDFIISMTPLTASLTTDEPGMGGFSYKDLYISDVGKYITYFNVQCYETFSVDNHNDMIKNGYPADMINMGMISSMNLNAVLDTIKQIVSGDNMLAGVYNWEYFDSPPDAEKNPAQWSKEIYKAIESKSSYIKALIAYPILPLSALIKFAFFN